MALVTAPKREHLVEYSAIGGALDKEQHVIRGVKLLGLESKNGRTYLPTAARNALRMYEGAKINVNHPKGSPSSPRDYQDRLGTARNVEFREGLGIYGDLHYNPAHPVAAQLEYDAQHSPESVGLSHNVEARTSKRDGKTVVESIVRVQSVDLVADPATTGGLYEHEEPEMSLAEMTLEQIAEVRADVKALTESACECEALKAELESLKAEKSAREHRESVEAALVTGGIEVTEQVREIACSLAQDKLPLYIESLQGVKAPVAQKPKGSEQTGPATEGRDFSGVKDTKSFVEAVTR
jgi:hypothetical protein